MSSEIDPAKLKVVDLRSELSARGLDTKGNKAVLVKRLKEALEIELKEDLPDTSIADTSTEELSVSQDESFEDQSVEIGQEAKQSVQETKENKVEHMEVEANQESKETITDNNAEKSENNSHAENHSEPVTAQNQDSIEDEEESNVQIVDKPNDHSEAIVQSDESREVKEQLKLPIEEQTESKGEKRKRESPSPDRSTRKRSKSPVREDEPPIDSEKVQLNWYDSDLHLQINKESFLSAKPFSEGAFGYAWAGARTTHGVTSGKVCFEIKISEELMWEDIFYERENSARKDKEERQRRDSKHEKKKEDKIKSEDPQAPKNGEESPEEKVETSETSETAEDGKESVTEENKEDIVEKTDQEETSEEKMDVEENSVPLPSHQLRVGWSLCNAGLQLGECKHSFGYDSTGKFVMDNNFKEYGVKYAVGDVIGSFLNITADEISVTYTVNGVLQPTTVVSASRSEFPDDEFGFFPHVLSRNYAFELNVGLQEEPWFPAPPELSDYVFVEKSDAKIIGPVRPQARSECEVIMMCGLPGSGKTHWVKNWISENPQKKYTVLGNTHLLERMTVNGCPLKNNYGNCWNVILDKLQKCLNRLLETATLRRRNYIIDQTNVFPSAQRRKLRPFEGFKRRAVIVVVDDEEQTKRRALQEEQDGKDVPDSAVLEMKANMGLPRVCDWLEEVMYSDLGEEESKAMIEKYNAQGREAGFGPIMHPRKDFRNDRNRWYNNRRNDYRTGYYRDKNFYRYDNRGPRGGNWSRPSGYRNDRRDNRGRDWRNVARSEGRDGRSHNSNNTYRSREGSSGRSRGGSWHSGYGGHGWNQGNGGWGGQGSSYQQGNWQSQSGWKYGQGYQGYQGNYSNYYYGQ